MDLNFTLNTESRPNDFFRQTPARSPRAGKRQREKCNSKATAIKPLRCSKCDLEAGPSNGRRMQDKRESLALASRQPETSTLQWAKKTANKSCHWKDMKTNWAVPCFLTGHPFCLFVCFIHYLFIFRLFWRNRSTVRYHTPVPQFLDFSVNLTLS